MIVIDTLADATSTAAHTISRAILATVNKGASVALKMGHVADARPLSGSLRCRVSGGWKSTTPWELTWNHDLLGA